MVTTLSIRRATDEDLPALLSLFGQPDMDGDHVISAADAGEVFTRMTAATHHEIYVAAADSQVVGTFTLILVNHLSHRGARSLIVEDVVVKTDWQGQGVGSQMMAFAAARGQQLRCYKLVLSSGLARERAHDFYEQLGFQRHGFSFLLPLATAGSP